MRRDSPTRPRSTSAGDYALTFGIAALVCAFIPIIGDFLAVPTGALALVFGSVGIWRHDSGHAPRVAAAAIGTILGAIALFVVSLMLIVTHLPA